MGKKLFIVLFTIVVGIASVSANAYSDADRLIKHGYVKSDPEAIRALSSQLSDSEKTSLYTWNRVNGFSGTLMNATLGFGSGSFSQGDTLYGAIFLAGDTVFTGMIVWNILRNAGLNFSSEVSGDEEIHDDYKLALAGAIGAVALRVWQGIRAASYASRYNSTLAYALDMEAPVVALMPVMTKDGMGFSLGARIAL